VDHIKEALERTKKEHVDDANTVTREVFDEVEHEKGVSHSNGIKTIDGNYVSYTRTKVVSINEDIFKKNRIISQASSNKVIDAYRMLRTKILHKMRKNNWNSLAVTSASEGEGKTLTAINLAISLAMEVNQTVLLVDFDLRNPSIHKYFDYHPENGLNEYLFESVPLNEILFNPGIERLVILPGSKSMLNSSEMLSSPNMLNMVEEIKNRYPSRYIVFDLPPLLSTDDALAFSPYTDATLLVVEDGRTCTEDLLRASEMLKNFNLIGTVLNKSNEQNSDAHY